MALPLLDEVADSPEADAAVTAAAAGLGEAIRDDAGAGDAPLHWPMSRGEMDVLALLDGHTDRDIARALRLSYEGVRSRVRRIFEKLGARSRLDAVRRARAQAILPPAGDAPQTDL